MLQILQKFLVSVIVILYFSCHENTFGATIFLNFFFFELSSETRQKTSISKTLDFLEEEKERPSEDWSRGQTNLSDWFWKQRIQCEYQH